MYVLKNDYVPLPGIASNCAGKCSSELLSMALSSRIVAHLKQRLVTPMYIFYSVPVTNISICEAFNVCQRHVVIADIPHNILMQKCFFLSV